MSSKTPPEACSLTTSSHFPEQLLIVGASVRSAAQSAARLGIAVTGVDLFGDADLRAVCHTVHTAPSPREFVAIAQTLPPQPWLYTGALENHPAIVTAISQRHRLLGNSAQINAAVRDPVELWTRGKAAGVEVAPAQRNRPNHGKWLEKPLRSAAGNNIQIAQDAPHSQRQADFYYQAFLPGRSLSLLAIGAQGNGRLLGIAEQLVGVPWCHARPFSYCGSVFPTFVKPHWARQAEAMVQWLCGEFTLTGLFGVDVIASETGLSIVEVNPRLTAAVEVFEQALNLNSVEMHCLSCDGGDVTVTNVNPAPCGKAILFAPRDISISAALIDDLLVNSDLADIPAQPQLIQAGHPVLTVLVKQAPVLAALKKTTTEVSQRITEKE